MTSKIKSASQYHAALSRLERYIEKGFGNLSLNETTALKSLSESVETYEKSRYPMPLFTSISDILIHHMQEENLTQAGLSKKIGLSNSAVSDIINGKKKPTLTIVIKLHEILKIDGNLLLKIAG